MELIFSFTDESQTDRIIDFFNSGKGDRISKNNRKREEFKWLFLDGYYRKALYALARESETDEIVGMYAGILIPMVSPDGKKIVTAKGEDTLISFDKAIKHGKRDILAELFHFLEAGLINENVSFMWGLSPVRSSFKRCGFEISGQVMGSFLVIKPIQFYNSRIGLVKPVTLKRKVMLFSFAVGNWLRNFTTGLSGSEFTVYKTTPGQIDFSRIADLMPKDSYALCLDEKFMKWRIERNPAGIRYGFLEFRDKHGDIIAYLIYSENRGKVFYIEQFLFHRSLSSRDKSDIVKLAAGTFKKEGAVMARAMGFSHNPVNQEEMDVLKKSGFHFFLSKEPSYFLFRNLSSHPVALKDIYVSKLNTQGVV